MFGKLFIIDGDLLADGPITWTAFVIIYILFLVIFLIKKKKLFYHVTFILFFVYLHMLFVLLFYPFPITKVGLDSIRRFQQPPYFNVIPFKSIADFVMKAIKEHFELIPALRNILGNIIAFIPFGFLLPCLAQSFTKFKKFVWLALILPVGVELTQLIGSLAIQAVWKYADIDDVILNMAGMLLGFLILKLFLRIVEKTAKIDILRLISSGKAKI